MSEELPAEHDVAFMTKARAVVPGIHRDIVKEKKRKERILPRSLRRAYRSKNKQHIEDQIASAMAKGFTKEEIKEDFRRWKKEKEFIK